MPYKRGVGLSLSVGSLLVGAGALAAWVAGLLGARADWVAVALLAVGAATAATAYALDERRARRQLAVVVLGINVFGALLVLATAL
jgi:4-hydroxybenzoate polyprenyltransferase